MGFNLHSMIEKKLLRRVWGKVWDAEKRTKELFCKAQRKGQSGTNAPNLPLTVFCVVLLLFEVATTHQHRPGLIKRHYLKLK